MKIFSQIKVVSVIGAGSWGTSIAKVLAEKYPAKKIKLWAFEKSVVQSVKKRRENREYLSGVALPENIYGSNSIKEALGETDAVLLAVPSKAVFEIVTRMERYLGRETPFAYLTKGFCRIDHEILTISQAISRVIPDMEGKVVAVSGPSHAEEVSHGFHTCLNVGSRSQEARSFFSDLLSNDYIQCRESGDIIGIDVGGTLKNPAAIAAGMISRLPGCGDNLAGALISEALKEMIQLGAYFKANRDTIIDISGLGDLVATSLSDNSRNRRFGRDIARQIQDKGTTLTVFDRVRLKFDPAHVIERMSEKLNYLAEGAYAIEPIIELAEMENIAIPVYRSLYEVLLNKKDPSLLIETIKNPEKYDELYHSTKIQLSDRKKGLENIKGKFFYKFIFNRVTDHLLKAETGTDEVPGGRERLKENLRSYCTSRVKMGGITRRECHLIEGIDSGNYIQSIETLTGLYIHEIIDHYSQFMKQIAIAYLYLCRLLNLVIGNTGTVKVSGELRQLKKIKTSENIVYVSNTVSVYDYLPVFHAINSSGLPVPRFFVHRKAVKTKGEELFVKLAGGYIVDPDKLGNRVYLEVLRNYLSILIEYGVPVLFFPEMAAGSEGTDGVNDFYTIITEAMFHYTVEIALVPLTIQYEEAPEDREHEFWRAIMGKSYSVHFSRQIYLSEYTKAPGMISRVSDDLNHVWSQ